MPGLFDIIEQMMGRPDPVAQLAAGLGQGPGQAGSPSGPQPLAQGGASAPPPTGAPPAGALGPNGAPGPQGPQGAPPQPQAYQSPPDMTQMYGQLMQRQQGSEMFNRGLGMLLSAGARPWNRQAIQQQWSGMTPDAGDVMSNVMKLQMYQQQQQRLQGLQASVPGLVKAYGMDPAMIPVLQNDPASIDSLISSHQPTGAYANRQLAEADYIKNNSDPNNPASVAKARADFEAKVPLINALTPAGGDPALNALNLEHNDYLARNGHEPDDDRFTSPEALAAYKAHNAALSNSQIAAQQNFAGTNAQLIQQRANANDILDAKDKDLQPVLDLANNPVKLALARNASWVASKLPSDFGATQDQLELLHKIDDLSSWNTGGIKQQSPHVIGNMMSIDQNLGNLQHFNVGIDNYTTDLKTLIGNIDAARATNIGVSGQLDRAIEQDHPEISVEDKLDPSYLAGGRNYLGEPKTLTSDVVQGAQAQLKQGWTPAQIVRRLQVKGYNPKPGQIPGVI